MTKSDRQRIREALKRYEDRCKEADGAKDNGETMLAAAVDWMRAQAKLTARYFENDDNNGSVGDVDGWISTHLYNAAIVVMAEAREFADEIRKEAKSL